MSISNPFHLLFAALQFILFQTSIDVSVSASFLLNSDIQELWKVLNRPLTTDDGTVLPAYVRSFACSSLDGPKCNFVEEDEPEEKVGPDVDSATSSDSTHSTTVGARISMLASSIMPLLKQLAADPKTSIQALDRVLLDLFGMNHKVLFTQFGGKNKAALLSAENTSDQSISDDNSKVSDAATRKTVTPAFSAIITPAEFMVHVNNIGGENMNNALVPFMPIAPYYLEPLGESKPQPDDMPVDVEFLQKLMDAMLNQDSFQFNTFETYHCVLLPDWLRLQLCSS